LLGGSGAHAAVHSRPGSKRGNAAWQPTRHQTQRTAQKKALVNRTPQGPKTKTPWARAD